jgi:hypothetical protein
MAPNPETNSMDTRQRVQLMRRRILYTSAHLAYGRDPGPLKRMSESTASVIHLLTALQCPYLLCLQDVKLLVARLCWMEYAPTAADRILLDQPFVRVAMEGRVVSLGLADLLQHRGLCFPQVEVHEDAIQREEGTYPSNMMESMLMRVKMQANFGVGIEFYESDRSSPDLPDQDGEEFDATMAILLHQRERRDAAIDAALEHVEARYMERFGKDEGRAVLVRVA